MLGERSCCSSFGYEYLRHAYALRQWGGWASEGDGDPGKGSGGTCCALGLLFEVLLPAGPSLGKGSGSDAVRKGESDAALAPAVRACTQERT